MAKMFYTLDETKAALGRSEDEIKQLCREGKLREFRDGSKLMFKADQVESLKATLPAKDIVDIADSGAPIALADSKSGTTGGSAPGMVSIKEDTSSGDTGLSGSFGGVPSARAANQASGTGSGLNIFTTDDVDSTDSSAQTAIASGDQGGLEPGGSGSGLVDLTRESDDTSLGAVLDEIPGAKRDPTATGTATAVAPAAAAGAGPAAAFGRVTPVVVVKPDAAAPFFGGLALGGAVLSLFALFVLASAVTGASVVFLKSLVDLGFLLLLAAGLVVTLVCGGIGFGLGKVIR